MSVFQHSEVISVNDQSSRNAYLASLKDYMLNTVGGFSFVGSGDDYIVMRHTASNRLVAMVCSSYYGLINNNLILQSSTGVNIVALGGYSEAPKTMVHRFLMGSKTCVIWINDALLVMNQDADDNWLSGGGSGLENMGFYDSEDRYIGYAGRLRVAELYNDYSEAVDKSILVPIFLYRGGLYQYRARLTNIFGCPSFGSRGWYELSTGEIGFQTVNGGDGGTMVVLDL